MNAGSQSLESLWSTPTSQPTLLLYTSAVQPSLSSLLQIQTSLLFLNMDADNVEFDPANMYARNPAQKATIISLVVDQAPHWAVSAVVV